MAMGREGEVQGDLVVTWAEMPRSPGHAFYDKLQTLLTEAAASTGSCRRPASPITRLGWERRHCRRAAISACTWSPGYFEGIDSERGIVWRCSDSYSLRDFLRLANRDKVPDPLLVVEDAQPTAARGS